MKKALIQMCHEHARVKQFDHFVPYVVFLAEVVKGEVAYEITVQTVECDKCKEDNRPTIGSLRTC